MTRDGGGGGLLWWGQGKEGAPAQEGWCVWGRLAATNGAAARQARVCKAPQPLRALALLIMKNERRQRLGSVEGPHRRLPLLCVCWR